MANVRMTKQLRSFIHEVLEQSTDTHDLIDMLIDRMSQKDKREWVQMKLEHQEMMP